MEDKSQLLKLAGNLGGSLLKATAITLITQVANSNLRKCCNDINEKLMQNIRYIKNNKNNL